MLSHEEKLDSFAEFFSEVEEKLRGAFTATFGMDVGPEVCADALAYGWEHWDRLNGMENPVGYLYRVGIRMGRRSKPSFAVAYEPRAVESTTWFEPGLATALNSLSQRQRVVVSLLHGYGWTMSEVAKLLGVGKSTVQSYEQRAMKRLRRRLGVVR